MHPHIPIPCHKSSFFVSFEGAEGSGKSTQGKKLCRYLKSFGKKVTLLREPGGTVFGEKLRRVILQYPKPLNPLTEAHLFASSRSQLIHEEILPRLELPHQAVILDRYYDSSVAYQGFSGGLGPEAIEAIHFTPPLCYMPHLTFYLRIPSSLSVARIESREKPKDYFESRGRSFFETIIAGFDWCAQNYPQRVVQVAGDQDVHQVNQEIQTILHDRLKDRLHDSARGISSTTSTTD